MDSASSSTADELARLQSARSGRINREPDLAPYDDDDMALYDDAYDTAMPDEQWDDDARRFNDDPAVIESPRGRGREQRMPRYAEDDGIDDDALYDDPYLSYEDDDWEPEPVPARQPRRRSARRPAMSGVSLGLPPAIAESPLVRDRISQVLVGGGLVSVIAMMVVTNTRIGSLPGVVATHISASGVAENLMTRGVVWQMPLMAGMVWMMNTLLAWFITRYDMMTARITLAATLLLHLVVWVAAIAYLWP